ncbi:MAG: helix-turn-helix transcriptional regulator [Planctomycetes bacterium]|nr:helix-turn-helix transcriptional regulator [Planctomycetota bacterium]
MERRKRITGNCRPAARKNPRPAFAGKSTSVRATGARTFVLVPAERFEELLTAERVLRAMAATDDPASPWIDTDVSALRLAGSRLKRARVARGLTQKEVARRLHIPQSQVSRIERDPDRSSLATLRRLAKALGVDVRALI